MFKKEDDDESLKTNERMIGKIQRAKKIGEKGGKRGERQEIKQKKKLREKSIHTRRYIGVGIPSLIF